MNPRQFSKALDLIIESEIKKEVVKSLNEMSKPKKNIVRLSENDLLKVIEKVLSEESIPGKKAYDKAHKESGTINKKSNKDTEKAIKAYQKDGSTNPEFPHANKQDKEVVARRNTPEQNEFIEDFIGSSNEDLTYSLEPSQEFKERAKNGLEGDTKTGNSAKDTGNTIETDTGKNMIKKAKRKKEKEASRPMYKKDEQPTGKQKDGDEDKMKKSALNEQVNSEMEKMKKLYQYRDRTQ
jgi:hypothetical protein